MADKALLLGINNYKTISDLRGCVSDTRNIKKLLVESFGFNGSENVRLLSNEEVVLKNVVEGFRWLYEGLEPGDRAVFHFSGHGSYVPSENDDEPTDEILCLWDMDWSNVNSYLIDDDLGELTQGLPKGAHLSVILDNCNSGTGTRAISGGRSFRPVTSLDSTTRLVIEADTIKSVPLNLQQKSRNLFTSDESSFRPNAENPIVFARFIYPPPSLRPENQPTNMRSVGKGLSESELNHTLLTGARDDQTAADAFIDGGYQGAFSHHLCNASRNLGAAIAVSEVMQEAKANLVAAGYSQVPQLEGIGRSQRLFGGDADPSPKNEDEFFPTNEVISNENPFTNTSSLNSDPMKVLSRLIDLQDRFLELGTALLDVSNLESSGKNGRIQSRSTSEVIVYVHGISRHVSGYSTQWFNAMHPHLTRTIPKQEVLWSDLVNPRTIGGNTARASTDESSRLADALRQELRYRKERTLEATPFSDRARSSEDVLERGDGFAIDDFVRYMTNRAIRNAILQRFDHVVRPLLSRGTTLHIIAHSWGSVVAYEGMRNMDSLSLSGQVENLIVAGSALSIGTVQSNLFGRVTDGRRPVHVKAITNLDAGGDVVGGPIAGVFTISGEHVGLSPTGCRTIPFTNIAINPTCAHSSYFEANNVAVNRDIFANLINS